MKRLIASLLVIAFAFAAGGLSASLYFKRHLAISEKQTSALARWHDSEIALKEAELLITLHKGYLGTDERVRDAICFLVTSKVKQMADDRNVIQEGLRDPSRAHDAAFEEATKFFGTTAEKRFEVLLDSTQQLGCKQGMQR